jgi:hypothetical protein
MLMAALMLCLLACFAADGYPARPHLVELRWELRRSCVRAADFARSNPLHLCFLLSLVSANNCTAVSAGEAPFSSGGGSRVGTILQTLSIAHLTCPLLSVEGVAEAGFYCGREGAGLGKLGQRNGLQM